MQKTTTYMKNKSILLIVLAAMLAILSSCDKEGGSSAAKVTFRKANIAGASMLAVAQGETGTKAEGDIKVGPKALYTVSDDGKMVQVSYDIEVEGVNGDVEEFLKAHLIISPGFIFPVGDGWIWLANCYQQYDGDWDSLQKSAERSALSKIQNSFRDKYQEHHGAHYLIRKSDGALFEWTIEAGAPSEMDDGFKQPTFLNGWFHQLGNDLFARSSGWRHDGMSDPGVPSLVRLADKGNTLDAVNVLGDNISCATLFPAKDYLGAHLHYGGAFAIGVIAPPSFEPILLQDASGGKGEMFLLSVNNKLYLGVGQDAQVTVNDGKESYTKDGYRTDFFNLVVSGNSVTKGSLICSYNDRMFWGGDQCFVSTGETLSFWSGNSYDGTTIVTFDPAAKTVTSRKLPEHYPSREDEYVDGVAYVADGTEGYWECDLSKSAAERVTLDWSSAAEYQGKIVPNSLQLVRFEAASLTLQFEAYLSNGTKLNFYSSVVGADRGKIKTSIGGENNAGMVVTTMIRLN